MRGGALDETLGFIEQALDRIRAGEGGEAELHNVRAYLINVLELLELDPGIEAASDDPYAVAKVLTEAADRGTRLSRLLEEAPATGLRSPGRASRRGTWV